MSFFIIGLMESKDSFLSGESNTLEQVAQAYGYSVQIEQRFEDQFYRDVLNPIYGMYDYPLEETIEFELSDSPTESSFDYGISEFYEELYGGENYPKVNPNNTKLFSFLSELWNMHYIKRIAIVFSYALPSFSSLEKKSISFEEMLNEIVAFYANGLRNQQNLYFISK